MKKSPTTVFTLETGMYDSDAEEDRGKEVVMPTPCLSVYRSTIEAAAAVEGLNIVEGDIWFFAADGAPLEAEFSAMPYINSEKNTYFAGVYKLVPGQGETLQHVLAEGTGGDDLSPIKIVVYVPATDAYARSCGWPDAKSMNESIAPALDFLPRELLKRVRFEMRPLV